MNNLLFSISNKWHSLKIKTRFTIVLSIHFLVIIFLIYLTICYFIKLNFKKIIAEQQQQLIKSIAFHLDENFLMMQNYLINLSKQVPIDKIENFDEIQKFILQFGKEHTAVDIFFDRGLFIFSKDGLLVGEYPYVTSVHLKNLSHREYFINTFQTLKPYISKPLMGTREPPMPIVTLTVPLLDKNNNFKGIFAGSITLENNSLLGKLSQIKVGENGYFYLFNNERTIIYHPDKTRILKQDVPIGVNKIFDKAIEGFEGSMEITNSRGKHFLTTVKRLTTTGWILASNYPKEEIYLPLQNILKKLFLLTILISFLTLFSIWLMMFFQLKPLEKLTKHIKEFENDIFSVNYINTKSNDEIGILTRAFNNMISTVQNWAKEIKTINEELYNLSTTDTLTKLFNRRHIEKLLEQEIDRAKRYKNDLSILLLDLDNFKLINDTFGHNMGDKVLVETAKVLKETLRKCDFAGRLGGEEFLVILPSTSLTNALVVAERIRIKISDITIDKKIKFSCSIGVSQYKNETADEFIIKVDRLMYKAKKQGKNRTVYQ